jgi:anthranilate phosphoribosyltransferase
MSKFFTPVEFEEPEDPGHQRPATVVVWDKEKLDVAWTQIKEEIAKIKDGTSEYVPRAINPSHFGFPAANAVKIFIKDPSDKAFLGIRDICRQDFMGRAGDRFHELLKACREEKPND